MYPSVIMEIANAVGIKPHRAKYRMWHHVIYIGETAMVFDEVVRGGGHSILPYEKASYLDIPKSYIIEAIQNKAFSLGQFGSRLGGLLPWHERIGKYPPGYFTHKIGSDVSSL